MSGAIMDESQRLKTCLDFFEQIFGDSLSENRKLTIFTVPDKVSRRFVDVMAAAEYAVARSVATHVYHGVGTVDNPVGRGAAGDIKSISSLWCDVDVKSAAHPSERLPKTIEDAMFLLREMPLAPSIVVGSGNGLHGYWIFEEPWVFANEEERIEAGKLAKLWHGLLCKKAKARGWDMENLGDLPRVLRTPGTTNPRTGAAVEVLASSGEVFNRSRFASLVQSPEAVVRPSANRGGRASVGIDRVRNYLDKIPGAVEGAGGGTQTLLACKALFRFGLSDEEARQAFEIYNARCSPPWTIEKQIAHKLADAKKSVIAEGRFGCLLNQSDELIAVDLAGILATAKQPIACSVNAHDNDDDPTDDLSDGDSTTSSLPAECLHVPGLIEEIAGHTLGTSLYQQPELALGGALALLGTITGRKVTDAFGTRTNVYVLGLGLSGVGKEQARKINKDFLLRSGGEKLIGSERIGSHAGIVTTIHETPASLMQLDEMGRLLETMKDPRKAPHLFNCITVLMQLYSSSSTLWKADAYADAKRVKTIDQPHLCIYGTATPDSFWHSLSTDNIAEGLIGRLLVFEGRGYELEMQEPAVIDPPPTTLDALRWWHDFRPGGNLAGEHPRPAVVPHTPEARERFLGHVRGINAKRKTETPLRAAVWSRSGEKVAKLALLRACSRARCQPEAIVFEDVDWAIRLGNWLTRRLLVGCAEHVSENDVEAKAKRVLGLLNGKGLTASQLCRKTQWLRKREREEIVNDLIGCGLVVTETIQGDTKPRTFLKKKAQR